MQGLRKLLACLGGMAIIWVLTYLVFGVLIVSRAEAWPALERHSSISVKGPGEAVSQARKLLDEGYQEVSIR